MSGKGRFVHHDERAYLFVGTAHGVFVYDGDFARQKWKRLGPHLPEHPINSIAYDYRDCKSVYVAAKGAGLHRTQDHGRTWKKIGRGLPADVNHVAIGHHSEPETIWVGLRPAQIARSSDGGETFEVVEGFSKIPSRAEWWGRDGETAVNSIIVHPTSHRTIHAAVSVGGVFYSDDEGETWEAGNDGIKPSYPASYEHADAHREVFQLVSNPAKPDRFYALAPDGVYRTDDSCGEWKKISEELESSALRSIAISPSRPGSIYVVPLDGDGTTPEIRGPLSVCRSTEGGETWDRVTEGLEVESAGGTVHREAMCVDELDEEGIYFATSRGSIFVSLDDGESWSRIATGLTAVHCLEIIAEQE